ncbi:threonine-phosphate decarboxylase CobD [Crenobacter intestini]|uniref:threonine-phosphate decarboxylase CobD n=1 Tax=Crenobacter intestini TaxID=2563443 RepID=UPI001EFF64D5|nr:threonine-phosphate decarboxylase CobD [Crenobacter intestini]
MEHMPLLPHGGNLADARRRYGDLDWIDLSAGLSPYAYPVPPLAGDAWQRLPEADPLLTAAASRYYGAPALLPVAGTQAAIRALPRLFAPCRVLVASPTYGEHAHGWQLAGHRVETVSFAGFEGALGRADIAIICNPNNPTGERTRREALLAWADALAARGGVLVVDEAFADVDPAQSVADCSARPGLIVLRSVGKFFGLAGLRLGFVAASPALLARLAAEIGPWTVSGPAQAIGRAALADTGWQQAMRARLTADGERLHALLARHGCATNGSALFAWWPQADPACLHAHFARHGLWLRLFDNAARGLRCGLPPDETAWQRLTHALASYEATP